MILHRAEIEILLLHTIFIYISHPYISFLASVCISLYLAKCSITEFVITNDYIVAIHTEIIVELFGQPCFCGFG